MESWTEKPTFKSDEQTSQYLAGLEYPAYQLPCQSLDPTIIAIFFGPASLYLVIPPEIINCSGVVLYIKDIGK